MTLGLSGEVLDDWKYDVYAQIGANDQVNRQTANLLTSKIEELTFAPDGGVSICGGFDPFGLGSISAECMEYISTDASNHAEVDQTIAEASVSGPLIALPAGDLKAAFGVFYKEDKYQYTASPVASVILEASDIVPFDRADIQGFSASDDIKGDDHNLDVYAELLVPLLRDAPGAESLEAVVGYRLSDYASAGSFDSWKAELIYQPIDARATARFLPAGRSGGQRVRALPPATARDLRFLLFSGSGGSVRRRQPGEDRAGQRAGRGVVPRAGHTAHRSCQASLGSDFVSGGKTGGNPDLGPEEATTSTIGVVWTPPLSSALFSNLQVSLDWYEIDIADKIDKCFSSISASSATTAGTTRTSPLRTSGARCSRATRSPAG